MQIEGNKCIRCGNYPSFKHPVTGKIYKLCAACGLKELAKLIDCELDENFNLVRKSDQILEEGG